ncbi:unnamed protein product [Sphenostylis stenocarpa]|uniref:Uncharacterized protein n=1 Tax=Sphenostylis stenocarpa TaxID=92480 RepID=A0AA86S206_9FABA|nr:unnamed protein product [Sphenostylis stenocarpa]
MREIRVWMNGFAWKEKKRKVGLPSNSFLSHVGRKEWKATSKKAKDEAALTHSVMHLVVHGTVGDSLVLFLHVLLLQGQGCIQRRVPQLLVFLTCCVPQPVVVFSVSPCCELCSQLAHVSFSFPFNHGSRKQPPEESVPPERGDKSRRRKKTHHNRLWCVFFLRRLMSRHSSARLSFGGAYPTAMVGLVGAAGPVMCMHERRSIIPIHKKLCMATTTSAWRMAGSSPTTINFGMTLFEIYNMKRGQTSLTPIENGHHTTMVSDLCVGYVVVAGCILGVSSSSPSACPTKSFVHIFSHRYDSYVVFHSCNLKLVLMVLYSMHG